MAYNPEVRGARYLQVLKFFGTLAMPVLILGSAITVAEWAESRTATIELARTPAPPR